MNRAFIIMAISLTHNLCSAKVNDTGANLCVDDSLSLSAICKNTGQDGETGRDITNKSARDGRVGFSYKKVCNSGELAGSGSCPVSPVLGNLPNNWGCVKDNITGLTWEIKTSDGGLRDKNRLYTHFSDGREGSALAFVAAVNATSLCGVKNARWRLPTQIELQSIVDYGIPFPGPSIDTIWFPNTLSWAYWTADRVKEIPNQAFGVNFYSGIVANYLSDGTNFNLAVRLVRSPK